MLICLRFSSWDSFSGICKIDFKAWTSAIMSWQRSRWETSREWLPTAKCLRMEGSQKCEKIVYVFYSSIIIPKTENTVWIYMSNGDLDAGVSKQVLRLFRCVQYKTYQHTLKSYKYASKLQTVLSPVCICAYIYTCMYILQMFIYKNQAGFHTGISLL